LQIVHDLNSFIPTFRSSVLTLGVFDGLHTGHQALLSRLKKRALPGQAKILVTYDPHPDIVLGKAKPHRTEIFTYHEKLQLLQEFDLDVVVFLPFTKELARMSAISYLEDILIKKLKASHIIFGYDQCFGKDRKGNYDFLVSHSSKFNFTVERIGEVSAGGSIVSSSRIRSLVAEGNIETANILLCKNFFLTGTVVRGFQRGRKLGYPTANLDVPETKLLPAPGVYIGYAEWSKKIFRAMIHAGTVPTFGLDYITVEAHLLDFSEDIYGEQLKVSFVRKIRNIEKFSGMEELKARLENDRSIAATVELPRKNKKVFGWLREWVQKNWRVV